MSDPLLTGTERMSGLTVIRRGLQHSPEILQGIGLTIFLAVLSTAGGTVIPILVRHVIDSGLADGGDVDAAEIKRWVFVAFAVIVLIIVTGYWSKVRIFTAAEAGLSTIRVRAFRHVHDLSMLTQNS